MTWTPERRQRQAEAIRSWAPWDHSTGPVTTEGKARASRNADRGLGAERAMLRRINKVLRQHMTGLRSTMKGLP